jgi:hypothetical protein
MKDFIDIGSSPPGEACAQVGSNGYREQARRECRAYVALLRRHLGDEPRGAHLSVTCNPHDFGPYLSVVCYFDNTIPGAEDFAFRCEAEGPEFWDETARRELLSAEEEAR